MRGDIHDFLREFAQLTSGSRSVRGAHTALMCLGGLEIAAMVGAYMAAPDADAVVVVDGFISGVAALCAAD